MLRPRPTRSVSADPCSGLQLPCSPHPLAGAALSEGSQHKQGQRSTQDPREPLILEQANLVVTVKRGREKLHYLNPVPIHGIAERWIGKFERHRLQTLGELKKGLEERNE